MATRAATLQHHTGLAFWQWLASLRYSLTGSRDYRLDMLRGFCVVAMLIDHVGGASWLYGITGGNRWVVSAGEGFVFLSGLVVGLVYTRKMMRSGLAAATWSLLKRARLLYLVTVSLTLAFVGMAAFTDLSLWVDRAAGLGTDSWTELIVGALALRYAYHGTDILGLYTILLVVSPALLFLLREGHARWVLLSSWLLWAAYSLLPGTFELWEMRNAHYFPLAAWQVLFVTGLVIGYKRATSEQRSAVSLERRVANVAPWILGAMGLMAAVLWLRTTNPGGVLPPSSFLPHALEHEPLAIGIWDKIALGPGRLAAFAIIAASAYMLLTALWRPLNAALGWLLVPLGAGALSAYAIHLFVIVAGYSLGVVGFSEPELINQNSVAQVGLVLFVWALLQLPTALRETWAAVRSRLSARTSGQVRTVRHRVARPLHHRTARGGRILMGCLVMSLGLLSLTHTSVRGAPETERLSATVGTVEPGWASLNVDSQTAIWGGPVLRSQLQTSWPAQVGPITVPGDELFVPGYALPLEGPRAFPLPAGQLLPRMFSSQALETYLPYYVYLPPGYDEESDRRYPVLYVLHGYYGNFMEWAEVGIHQVADRLILNGLIEPMIIVMAEGRQSYFVNQPESGERWADSIADELVTEVDSLYRTIPEATSRAVGGLSMGGMGALYLAFERPDVFRVVGAHSPTLRWDRPVEKWTFGDDDHFQSVNPLETAQRLRGLDDLKIWLDVGEEDWGWFTVEDLHYTLLWRGIPHEFQFLQGGHDPEYWITHQWRYLDFYDRAFRSAQSVG